MKIKSFIHYRGLLSSSSIFINSSNKNNKYVQKAKSGTKLAMIKWFLLISRQGKVRLSKWYASYSSKEKTRISKDVSGLILSRSTKLCNFLEYKEYKIIYKRYASLYFCCGVDADDNELLALEIIHQYVEILDKYFGNVCELDLIFNFHKAYYILDEMVLAGEFQESSRKSILRVSAAQDAMMEDAKNDDLIPTKSKLSRGMSARN